MSAITVSFTQFVADCSMLFFGCLAFGKAKNSQSKIFFGLILISILFATFSNEIQNLTVNFFKISPITPMIDTFWTLPYVTFLLVQILSWSYLLFINRHSSNQKSWLKRSAYLQSAMVLALTFFIIFAFKNDFLKNLSSIEIFNSLLESALFILILPCLTRSKSKALSLIATGFLFAIAFNLAHRFAHASGHYHEILSTLWLICPLIVVAGLVVAIKSPSNITDFFEKNSIHVLVSTFTLSATFITLFFAIAGFLISPSESRDSNFLPENMASVLVFSFSLSVLLSKLSANYFSRHLGQLSERVNLIQNHASSIDQLPQNSSQIHEIGNLDRFILKTIDQLQAANRVKSEFLRNMSHDFRTPASGIRQMSNSIYKRMPENDLKRLQKLIVDSSSQLMNLLDEVLHYSHLENINSKSIAKKLDVIPVVEEIISFSLPKIEENGLCIKTHFSKESIEYDGDRMLLHRILLNLVSNAVKFTPKGFIEISVSEAFESDSHFLRISVKDTGIGIAREHLASIFEPFYRVQSSDLSSNSGIGLGLTNVKLMLRKMQGEIAVESLFGEGSTFTLLLPQTFVA